MAVQAQYPSDAFSPDFRPDVVRTRNTALEELQILQDHRNLLSVYSRQLQQGFNNSSCNNNNNNNIGSLTAFSDHQSELTCNNNINSIYNSSGSRKRCRKEYILPLETQYSNISNTSCQFFMPNSHPFRLTPVNGITNIAIGAAVAADTVASNGQYNIDRLLEPGATSTSGRPLASSAFQMVSPLAKDLVSQLYHQNLEIDALVRLHTERIWSGLEEAGKRHCRALVSVIEQQVLKRLREKEAELENASRRNAELEEKIGQMTAENQIWFNVAKNNEAIVSSLRSSLEQVLLQGVAAEGFGDSDGVPNFPADDALSCCFEECDTAGGERVKDLQCRKSCKACGEREVSVLVLPCRHLCLCKGCESKVDACPICGSSKNACLQVFMS